MAGSRSNVHFAEGFRLQSTSSAKYPIMQKLISDVGIINNSGAPEGIVSANPGSICHDRANGDLYVKKTGTGTSGWILLATTSGAATTFMGDSGSASPVANVLNILGGTGIDTVCSGNTVTIDFDVTEVPTVLTTMTTDAGMATTALNNLNILGGTGIDTSASGSTITVAFDVTEVPTIPTSVVSDSGNVTPSVNSFSVVGGAGITTSAVGSVLTIALVGGGIAVDSFTTDVGGPVSPTGTGNITVTGTNIFSTGSVANTIGLDLQGTNHALYVGRGTNTASASLSVGATNTVLLGNTGADPSFGTVPNAALTNSSITLSNGANVTVTGSPVSLGGAATIAVSGTTNHAVQVGNASGSLTSIAIGATNTVLLGNTGIDPSFGTVPNAALSNSSITLSNGNNITITGSPVSLGGAATVNVSGTTNHAIQVGNASGSLTSLSAATNGQLPIGFTGSDPVITTLTAGSGISISNGAGSITINATGVAFTWNEITGTSSGMAVNNGYISNNAGLVTLTLPSTAAFGDIIRVGGKGAGGWKIAQNASQVIHFGSTNTTTGTGGSLASTNRYDAIHLVCITANTDFLALSSIGNITVV